MAEDSEAIWREGMLKVRNKINLNMEVPKELVEKSSEGLKLMEKSPIASAQAEEFIINVDDFLQNYDGIIWENENTTLATSAATTKTHANAQDVLLEEAYATATAKETASYASFNSFTNTVMQKTKIAFDSTIADTAVDDAAPAALATITQNKIFPTPTDFTDDSSSSSIHTTTNITIKNNNCSYQCIACEYNCDTMESLNEHSKIHRNFDSSNNFNFQCAICDCKYKTIQSLKHHFKRHNARNYPCTDCPKTYISKSELEYHKIVHTGEMPHKCDMCSKQFRLPHHLKRHRDVVHYGERYQCSFIGCGRTFKNQAHVKKHAWNHYGIIPYKCKYCDRDLKRRSLLRQHAIKVHNVIMTEEEIAEIYRNRVGCTNPHDFTVKVANGQMLRRSEVETNNRLLQ